MMFFLATRDSDAAYRVHWENSMHLDHAVCYRALSTRDPRFDGRFFTGVTSTGVFCRPVCPAPLPREENCKFYPSAAAAREAGFRPCLRCRPELAPDILHDQEGSGIVTRALEAIATGALDEDSVGKLASRLAVTERHLRRLFVQIVGAPPNSVAQTRRLLFARQLMDDTDLSLADVAFAAGFGSIRRFNAVMQATYHHPPRDLRRERVRHPASADSPGISLRLAFTPPYDWDSLIGFLMARAIPGVEIASPDRYCRAIELDGKAGLIEMRPHLEDRHLRVSIHFPDLVSLSRIAGHVRAMFDLNTSPAAMNEQLERDPVIGKLVTEHPGLRVPTAWQPFEAGVRAIIGQQISVKAARTVLGRLVERCGDPLPAGGDLPAIEGITHTFPRPQAVAAADLSGIGLTGARLKTLQAFASAASDPEFFATLHDLQQTLDTLTRLPGIGAWTAQYIALRGLQQPDAFPASDLGLVQAISALLGEKISPARLAELSESWRPWRAYAAMHLWKSLE
jgi:AraC family transcriptional regulator of adaptative response / DNA-3-methyladenine glycosylase II